jgi:hypothetical protein
MMCIYRGYFSWSRDKLTLLIKSFDMPSSTPIGAVQSVQWRQCIMQWQCKQRVQASYKGRPSEKTLRELDLVPRNGGGRVVAVRADTDSPVAPPSPADEPANQESHQLLDTNCPGYKASVLCKQIHTKVFFCFNLGLTTVRHFLLLSAMVKIAIAGASGSEPICCSFFRDAS